ncbi:MAG: hypothetical protein ISS36_04455 [Candidatus Aenigmarchaeota archaeon]|nr:hypothetical protein [Candidatus Aenigmarchaeota archaeon]
MLVEDFEFTMLDIENNVGYRMEDVEKLRAEFEGLGLQVESAEPYNRMSGTLVGAVVILSDRTKVTVNNEKRTETRGILDGDLEDMEDIEVPVVAGSFQSPNGTSYPTVLSAVEKSLSVYTAEEVLDPEFQSAMAEYR